MDPDDPWHWSVDRVVQELCTAHRSWQLPPSTSSPQVSDLESVLREQGVTGSILLLDIDDNTLRNDFKFKTLSQRAFIRRAVEELRLHSAQYRAHVNRHFSGAMHPSLQNSGTGDMHHSSPSTVLDNHFPFGQPYQIGQGAAPIVQTGLQPPASFPHPPPAATPVQQLPQDAKDTPLPTGDETTQVEFIISDGPGNKRRKLDIAKSSNDRLGGIGRGSPEQVSEAEFEQLSPAQDTTHQSPPSQTSEPAIGHPTDSNAKKRKRIAPTLVSSDIRPPRDRQAPNEADTVLHYNPDNIEPGVPFITDDGKKRVVPVLLASPDSEPLYNHNNLLQVGKPTRKRAKRLRLKPPRFLGKKSLTADSIFYTGTAVGQDLPTESVGELSVFLKNVLNGERLYVHHVIREYLLSEVKSFERDGNLFYAVCPYPFRLAQKYHSPSFTLFYRDGNGQLHARREEARRWPEICPAIDSDDSDQLSQDGDEAGILAGRPSIFQTFDFDVLLRYEEELGAKDVFPLYGESDEENEYDMETWAEIEEEQGNLNKPLRPLKRQLLSLADVNKAIDEGIAMLVTKWREERLPKLKQKAFRVWTKCHKSREVRRHHIQGIQKLLDRIDNDRLPKLRKEIASEHWTSAKQVQRQTRILEQSIYDRESSAWEIGMLNSLAPPEKPLPKTPASIASKKPRPTQDYEEGEGESLESDCTACSSDEDMDDFIVDDSESATGCIEMNLADTEDEDEASASDSSSWSSSNKDPEVRPPPKKRLVTYPESDDNMDIDELDERPVKDEPMLPALPPTSSNNADNPIDLTILSSDDGPGKPSVTVAPPKKKPRIKLIHKGSPFDESAIAISDEELLLPDMDNLPPYNDTDAIAGFSYEAWAQVSDRERLLILVVNGLDNDLKAAIFSFVASISEDELWSHMLNAIVVLLEAGNSLKGMDDGTFQTLVAFIRLFNIYTRCKFHSRDQPPDAHLKKLPDQHAEWFPRFYGHCLKLEDYISHSTPMLQEDNAGLDGDDEDIQPAIRRRRAINTVSEDDNTQGRKRKRQIYENKEARDMRENDRKRLEEQEARRKRLQKKFPLLQHAEGRQDSIIINDGKYEHQGFVYINNKIAPLIKQHQIQGVRFMWSQIITDSKKMQGCLLAHTMGLGKTMQVITLLCAIAEASNSPDESVASQVPIGLRTSKTLVLCPAGLIDNWLDELLTWAPKGLLGSFRRVSTTMKTPERLQVISNWFHEGGVLILGYEMFRSLHDNKKTAKREARFSEDVHETLKDQLLNGPNIIVADEAHKMKNANSGLAQSTAQFRSKSRIALTGSPLANNVTEYHTMIDWVAPNYLGPAVEFRAKYVEPIEDGLWNDSTPAARRKSLKMLGVLKEDIGPKVHRADMSVLRNDLPPKKEFVITVPLTDLQKKAYTLYVKSMVSGPAHTTKDGDFSQTTVWHWLAILSLLCNHPDCFNKKLNERKEDARNKDKGAQKSLPGSLPGTDQEDGISTDLNTPIWKVGVSQELVNKVTELFEKETTNLKDINLSNKVKVLCQILDAARAAGDKVLVFSQSLPTLDLLEEVCRAQGRIFFRLDGSTPITKRQEATKSFNVDNTQIYLISTAAGGLGLNIFGANRVVIFDFKFNPIMEEQAVGRAYRIGQQKPVFVYRFLAGGTFEDAIHNKAVFKTQLASRVVDKKNPVAWARKGLGDMLFEPKDVDQNDLSEFVGMDPLVLDPILSSQGTLSTIRGIVQTDTFHRDDDDKLTAEEEQEVKQLIDDEQLKRYNPKAYHDLVLKRNWEERHRHMGLSGQMSSPRTGLIQPFSGPVTNPATPTAPPGPSASPYPNGGIIQPFSGPGTNPATPTAPPGPSASPYPSGGIIQPFSGPRTKPAIPPALPGPSASPYPNSGIIQPFSGPSTKPAIPPTLPGPSGSLTPSNGASPFLGRTQSSQQHQTTSAQSGGHAPHLMSPRIQTASSLGAVHDAVSNSPSSPVTHGTINSVPKKSSSSNGDGNIKEVCVQQDPSLDATQSHADLLEELSSMVLEAKEPQVTQPENPFDNPVQPLNFHMCSDEEMEEFLHRHGLSTEGNRPELVARCLAQQSAMFVAMKHIPTPKPRHPSKHKRTPRRTTDDAHQIHQEFKRLISEPTSPRNTAPSSNGSTKIPRWAESEIREASRGLNQRRASSRGTPSVKD